MLFLRLLYVSIIPMYSYLRVFGSMFDQVIYFILGFMGALIGSMVGLGGGSIIIPILYLLGFPPTLIVGSTKLAVFANSLVSSYRYSREIDLPRKLYYAIAIPMIITAFIGAYLVVLIDKRYLVLILGMVIALSSIRLIIPSKGKKDPSERGKLIVGVISGTISGLIAGLTGLGGGIINVPMFIYVLRLDPHLVVSLSMACILPSALSSVVRHFIDGIIYWQLAIPLSLGAAVGGYTGAHITLSIRKDLLRRIIGGVLLIVAIRIIISSIYP